MASYPQDHTVIPFPHAGSDHDLAVIQKALQDAAAYREDFGGDTGCTRCVPRGAGWWYCPDHAADLFWAAEYEELRRKYFPAGGAA